MIPLLSRGPADLVGLGCCKALPYFDVGCVLGLSWTCWLVVSFGCHWQVSPQSIAEAVADLQCGQSVYMLLRVFCSNLRSTFSDDVHTSYHVRQLLHGSRLSRTRCM